MTGSHCQICDRLIKANTGVIALHGYKRPGIGWQTSSCFGARFRPYEVAADAIPLAIESLKSHIAKMAALLAEWQNNPPATIKYQRRDAYGRPKGEEKTFDRPANFVNKPRTSNRSDTYEIHWDNRYYLLARDIKASSETLEFLQTRLDEWKAPPC